MPSIPENPQNRHMREMFTRIAGMYDRLNRVLTLGIDVLWRRRALARLQNVEAALDLATGTADLAIATARRFPAARVTGIDLTPAMLEVGRAKVARAGLAVRIDLREGDASALPFEATSFDTVTCAFGFRNFPDRVRALQEVFRVLKPGGRLLVLELFRPKSRVLGGLTAAWLRRVSPFFAGEAQRDYAYLRASIAGTCSTGEFVDSARRVGFSDEFLTFFLPSCTCLVLRKCDKITV